MPPSIHDCRVLLEAARIIHRNDDEVARQLRHSLKLAHARQDRDAVLLIEGTLELLKPEAI